jgi:hypothetical protein
MSSSVNDLLIQGGWGHDFTHKYDQPWNTVLDGGGDASVLAIIPTNDSIIDVTIDNMTLENGVDYLGGGIHIRTWSESTSSVEIRNCIIRDNHGSMGGGINAKALGDDGLTRLVVRKSKITGNTASMGGGLFIGSDLGGEVVADLDDNIISHNEAIDYPDCSSVALCGYGGGIYVGSLREGRTTVQAVNNMITANKGDDQGGLFIISTYPGVEHATTNVELINNTVAGNVGNGVGAEAFGEGSTKLDVINSVVWGNSRDDLWIGDGDLEVKASHSVLGDVDNLGGVFHLGDGIIYEDPLFAYPADNDFHLQRGSPAIDGGIGWKWFFGYPIRIAPALDFEGDLRPWAMGQACDIGADEFIPYERFVSTTGDDTGNDCSDPLSPCATVHHAVSRAVMDRSVYKNDIKVARGSYHNENVFITALDRIRIKGGWNEDFSARVRNATLTTLDGGGADSVIFIDSEDAVIEFFLEDTTIQNGSANGGGGIRIMSRNGEVDAWFFNNVVKNNSALYGGGVYLYREEFSPRKIDRLHFYNTIISDNEAHWGGGAALIETRGSVHMWLDSCTVAHNHAAYGGGILLQEMGSGWIDSEIESSIVWLNSYGENPRYADDIQMHASANWRITVDASYSDIGQVIRYGGTYNSDVTNILQDPLFVDILGGDYRLKRGSPAIDAGLCGFPFDFEGDSRPQGSGCDMGADEYVRTFSIVRPDLVIAWELLELSIDSRKGYVAQGALRIENQGAAPTKKLRPQVVIQWPDGSITRKKLKFTAKGGHSQTLRFKKKLKADCIGKKVLAIVDKKGKIAEGNERNNTATIVLTAP